METYSDTRGGKIWRTLLDMAFVALRRGSNSGSCSMSSPGSLFADERSLSPATIPAPLPVPVARLTCFGPERVTGSCMRDGRCLAWASFPRSSWLLWEEAEETKSSKTVFNSRKSPLNELIFVEISSSFPPEDLEWERTELLELDSSSSLRPIFVASSVTS